MQVLTTVRQMSEVCASLRRQGRSVGLVPTMGALHAGHLSLVEASRAQCDTTAVSIFVNPTQFGPNEDFAKYPRTFAQDRSLLEAAGVELLFAPEPAEMYPAGAETFVEVGELGTRLDGASRPGHFRGVATIVAKLFHIVAPDKAFFGQKDAAQVAVLRRMVRDLNFGLELIVCPTMREPDGLAMSSRNRYLSAAERAQALALSQALRAVAHAWQAGEVSVTQLLATGATVLEREPSIRLDYFEIVDPDTLLPLAEARSGALVAVAAGVGSTRLIDNLLLAS